MTCNLFPKPNIYQFCKIDISSAKYLSISAKACFLKVRIHTVIQKETMHSQVTLSKPPGGGKHSSRRKASE